ncbi:acetyl-CoA acetyltransferase [Caldovatus sediminis]|uniref:Acetyl-CoA acetyltransferase n=1 Tax=Caldovatus sediminis TaxID=2041189 RepID=A0A8J3EB19_9PROT|nr:thiolase family protein [Caldovatus sediminis]GGG32864.1 acetyl-CoA acetyltransferase [Caldovatus sediminis]
MPEAAAATTTTSRTDRALASAWEDAWLLDGVRTPFADLCGPFAQVSPTDLGIKAAREALARAAVAPEEVGTVIAGSLAPGGFDALYLPRHVGLYAGVPIEVPSVLVQRLCGTGIEALIQAADTVTHKEGIEVALCVGTESMSRNPVAAFTHRTGFGLGRVEFKDFLWEALHDPAPGVNMGGTAEELARRYQITRAEVDAFAARSFDRALAAQASGFLEGEIAPVRSEVFTREGYADRAIELPRKVEEVRADTHVRPSPVEALAKIRPAFGGVQTGGNSSGMVDGAAAALVVSGAWLRANRRAPLARLVAGVAVGCPPEIMGIGPVPAIRALLARTGRTLAEIDRIEINEAFGAQVMACARELGLDEDRLNVNGGAIAIGHPLAATGLRIAVTLARELRRSGGRLGIASACIGGGQGIALLVENPEAAAGGGAGAH